jgi:hypothetical protein
MKLPKSNTAHHLYMAVAMIICLCLWPTQGDAQIQGNNAVWSTSVQGSAAFIDASAFLPPTNPPDICQVLYNIITGTGTNGYPLYPTNGAVIDARGINAANSKTDGSFAGDMTCAYSPWSSSGGSVTTPATILLPGGYNLGGGNGTGVIIIHHKWVVPNGSRVIGEGPNSGLVTDSDAILRAAASFPDSVMIQMGDSNCPEVNSVPVCTGVSVEHLTLDAQTQYIDGIDNPNSQLGSYVDDVQLSNVGYRGLYITAQNSGPYSNPYYTTPTVGCSGAMCPTCVDLEAQTRGVHGISCIGYSTVSGHSSPNHAGIYVDFSNNTIEDVHVEGFTDGVQIGNVSSGVVANVVVSNITATWGTGANNGEVVNTVHICGPNAPIGNPFGKCANIGAAVQDVSVLQATDFNNSSPIKLSTVIQDDVTGTSITPPLPISGNSVPQSVAMYVLGEQVGGGTQLQYSRFGTSPSTSSSCSSGSCSTVVPPWISGNSSTGISGQTCNVPGAIYSNTAGASGSAIFVCAWTSLGFEWLDIA